MTAAEMTELRDIVAEELSPAVDPRVSAMAQATLISTPASRAVLFTLVPSREAVKGLMLDFYLIVSDYRSAQKSAGWQGRTG
jgi:hypothetical protein